MKSQPKLQKSQTNKHKYIQESAYNIDNIIIYRGLRGVYNQGKSQVIKGESA
tara:strand:- start:33 stop:188 length:156 start_codon:yes stop_codon:yes gene_type:complete